MKNIFKKLSFQIILYRHLEMTSAERMPNSFLLLCIFSMLELLKMYITGALFLKAMIVIKCIYSLDKINFVNL